MRFILISPSKEFTFIKIPPVVTLGPYLGHFIYREGPKPYTKPDVVKQRMVFSDEQPDETDLLQSL